MQISSFKTIAVLPPGGNGWSVRISPQYPGCFFFVNHDRSIKPMMVQPDGNMVILDNADTSPAGIPLMVPGGYQR